MLSSKPNRLTKGYRDTDIDIIALYQRNANRDQVLGSGRRHDNDERAKYIAEAKAKIGLNDKILALSSKRSTAGA